MEIAVRNGGLVEESERVEIEEDKWVEDLGAVGTSGKTTLTAQVCCVGQVTSYFNSRILREKIWKFISRCDGMRFYDVIRECKLRIQCEIGTQTLVTVRFTDQVAATLLTMLISISRKSRLYKPIADQLKITLELFLPPIHEIKFSGIELSEQRRRTFRYGLQLSYNVYKNLKLARKLEKLEKKVSSFMMNGPIGGACKG